MTVEKPQSAVAHLDLPYCTVVTVSCLPWSVSFASVSAQFSVPYGSVFTRESSYCFQLVLAIASLSACHTDGSVKNGAS